MWQSGLHASEVWKAGLQVHERRTSSWPLSRPAGGGKAKDDPCPSSYGAERPSMGGQLSGSLALDGTDLGDVPETIFSEEGAVERETLMMGRFSHDGTVLPLH